MHQVVRLTRERWRGKPSVLLADTHSACAKPCQGILKPLQSACTISDVHANYIKIAGELHTLRRKYTPANKHASFQV